MSHKKKNVEYLADFSIGTMLGDNPTQQEIEELLEEKRADLKQKSEEISKLKELISKSGDRSEIRELQELIIDDENAVESYKVQVEKLEGALCGKPLYTERYLQFQRAVSQISKCNLRRKKYELP